MNAGLVAWGRSHEQTEQLQPARLVVLGSTGSIGQQTLSVVRDYPEHFSLIGISAAKSVDTVLQQVHTFRPREVAMADAQAASELRGSIPHATRLSQGEAAIEALATHPDADIVVVAIVGIAGLRATCAALRAGKRVALANKESLVAGGSFVREALASSTGSLFPVDSEHAALHQILLGVLPHDVQSLILTASGGPFYGLPRNQLAEVTPEQAVRHPRWNMGKKISVDSATLMNKALELIEAHWMFGFEESAIEVLIHPQSIVHAFVRCRDGTLLAQLSQADMRAPIAHALSAPRPRLPGVIAGLPLQSGMALEFLALDDDTFPAVSLARRCIGTDRGTHSLGAVLNSANEHAVERFLKGELRFDRIVPLVESMLQYFEGAVCASLDDVLALHLEVGARCNELRQADV